MSRPAAPVIAVLQRGDSFERAWPEVAASAKAQLRRGASAESLAPLGDACAVLVVVAGREEECAEEVGGALAAGAKRVAVVGSAAEHRVAVAALRSGASEYFALPGDLEALRSWVSEQAVGARARAGAESLAAAERGVYDFSRLVGESEKLRAALRIAARVIPRGRSTVLITGETGTGKELLAQAVHYNGPRGDQPFVEVNCTALPPNLLEAELFGYEKGAFTDARTAKPGLFEAAHGGTLFLDEIGDLPLDLQGKLLRVLEERRVRRLGALRSVNVDVRIVAATNVDLADAVRAGRFREDLFFRLNVVPIHLPPLRERGSDVLLLAERFLAAFTEEYELEVAPLDDEVRGAILAHAWPGNVRELRNALERAVLLSDGRIRSDDLFRATPSAAPAGTLPFPASLATIERAAARAMVDRFGGNKSAAADALGISRSRLYRLLDGGGGGGGSDEV
ncbi:MAG TPA: sigma 54-interacting transcriptional regulator [Gemmatimonadota bacterium]|nr:sigma 54-interacting transcriptional regulator [Gemmatimonadota bacterium]